MITSFWSLEKCVILMSKLPYECKLRRLIINKAITFFFHVRLFCLYLCNAELYQTILLYSIISHGEARFGQIISKRIFLLSYLLCDEETIGKQHEIFCMIQPNERAWKDNNFVAHNIWVYDQYYDRSKGEKIGKPWKECHRVAMFDILLHVIGYRENSNLASKVF